MAGTPPADMRDTSVMGVMDDTGATGAMGARDGQWARG